jgi:polyhydroxyalkanoate synthesis regulator protein
MTILLFHLYPNRRLYNCERGAYTTLAEIIRIIRSGGRIAVFDSLERDVTRRVLIKALCEAEIEAPSLSISDLEGLLTFNVERYITDEQCERIIDSLENEGWKGITKEDVRLWSALTSRAQSTARSAEETDI